MITSRSVDRPAGALHHVAGAGDELARGIDRKRAVAGIARAARRLHDEIALAVDGDVEWIAGALHRAGAEVDPGGAVLHETDAAVLAGAEIPVAGARHEIFRK